MHSSCDNLRCQPSDTFTFGDRISHRLKTLPKGTPGGPKLPGTHQSLPTPCLQTLGLQADAVVSGFYVGAGVKLKPSCLCTMSPAPFLTYSGQLLHSHIIFQGSVSDCFFLSFLVFQDRVSLYNPGCPGTCSVDHTGFKLTEIHLPLPPKCWD